MKTLNRNQQGFGFLAVLLVIVVLGALALVAVQVKNNVTSGPASTAIGTNPQVPAKIQSRADLQKAATALDATSVDKGVNPDQLDTDLKALL